jgi:hypothetical protein
LLQDLARRSRGRFSSLAFDEQMAANAETLRRLVANLESRGCRIYFLELRTRKI